MAQVAVIQRHLFLPSVLPRVLYLAIDTLSPTEADWCAERRGAFEFSSHGAADDFAAGLRAAGAEHVHAVVSEKPLAHRLVPEPIEDLSGGCLSAGDTSSRSRRDEKPVGRSVPPAQKSRRSKKRARGKALRDAHARVPANDAAETAHSAVATHQAPNKFWWRENQYA